MNKLFLVILFIFAVTTHVVIAAHSIQAPKKLSIQVNLNYQERNRDGSVTQHSLTNTLKTSTNNHQWTAVENKSYDKSNQFVVLAKIEKANAKEITMKFLVLNTGIKPRIISSPTITMLYDQKAQMTIDEHHQNIQLIVITTAR